MALLFWVPAGILVAVVVVAFIKYLDHESSR
jgi:hypothetical protein